ncbi:hypothetical protein [Brachybacterium paraconglomeratum]
MKVMLVERSPTAPVRQGRACLAVLLVFWGLDLPVGPGNGIRPG